MQNKMHLFSLGFVLITIIFYTMPVLLIMRR